MSGTRSASVSLGAPNTWTATQTFANVFFSGNLRNAALNGEAITIEGGDSAHIYCAGFFKMGAAGSYRWDARSRMSSPVDGVITCTKDDGTSGAVLRLIAQTVASLPSASTYSGSIALVSDATATTARSTVAGGGANKVLVFSDGTNWLIAA